MNTTQTCSGPSMGKAPGREAQKGLFSYCPPGFGGAAKRSTPGRSPQPEILCLMAHREEERRPQALWLWAHC